jgi:drug/metabolite transporter (DMT)-like permease
MALIHAYDRGDFSLVYPIARGAAPALLAVWGALFLGESPRPIGLGGLGILLIGLLVVGGGSAWVQRRTTSLRAGGVAAAVGVAVCISTYSAVDGAAVRLMAPGPDSELVFALTAGLVTPAVLAR